MNCFALIKCRPYLYIDCYLPSVCNFFPPPLILFSPLLPKWWYTTVRVFSLGQYSLSP